MQLSAQPTLAAKAKLVWERLTFSKLTIVYVVFSFLHFGAQLGLQIQAFTINVNAASLLYSIALQGHATNSSFPALQNDQVKMCAEIPTSLRTDNCTVVYRGIPNTNNHIYNATLDAAVTIASEDTGYNGNDFNAVPVSSFSLVANPDITSTSLGTVQFVSTPAVQLPALTGVVELTETVSATAPVASATQAGPVSSRSLSVFKPQAKVLSLSNDTVLVNITGLGYVDYPLVLDRSCMWSLNWPVSQLDNTKREDIVFIAFQFWVLGMSIVAVLNESMPHIFASLLTHVMATAWTGFQISSTAEFRATFNRVITFGACNGVPSLLPSYWEDRARAEIPTLALNAVGLVISTILTWKLAKLFGWQTFKRVGASRTIKQVYHLVLFFSIVLQLGLFFMGATVSLFLDQLINGWAGHLAGHLSLYKIMFFITGAFLVPWLVTGWYSVRRENRWGMIAFLALCVWYLTGWAIMFLSTTFRWTFETWSFFALVSSFSIFFSVVGFLLGVVCRYNFGKGLVRYLNAAEDDPLPGNDIERTPSRIDEKVSFPTMTEKAVPTYSATFGSGSEVVSPFSKPSPQLGPRFFNSSAVPFESRSNSASSSPISPPAAALTRSTSTTESVRSNITAIPQHVRQNSQGSLTSYYDYSAGDASHARRDSENVPVKRWTIDD